MTFRYFGSKISRKTINDKSGEINDMLGVFNDMLGKINDKSGEINDIWGENRLVTYYKIMS